LRNMPRSRVGIFMIEELKQKYEDLAARAAELRRFL